MTQWLVDVLEDQSIEPVFAWYQPWSSSPALSVPLHRLLTGRRPGCLRREVYGQHQGHGIGAWFPELEFTHYLARRSWKSLIATCDILVAVTGTPISAAPFVQLGLPFLAWVASPWEADRSNRVRSFSLPRRLLDSTINAPVLRRQERKVLQAPNGHILALSSYTATQLEHIAGRNVAGILRMPVDTHLFYPYLQQVIPWRIGFTGRYNDPRKNIQLLLQAVQILVRQDHPVQLQLIGEPDPSMVLSRCEVLGIRDHVTCLPRMGRAELCKHVQSLDLFVIPSHQEGLCIAALEAMACGTPVISTKCGGPEDFVYPGITGYTVPKDPQDLATAIISVCGDRTHRHELSQGALEWVKRHASQDVARRTLLEHLKSLFPTVIF